VLWSKHVQLVKAELFSMPALAPAGIIKHSLTQFSIGIRMRGHDSHNAFWYRRGRRRVQCVFLESSIEDRMFDRAFSKLVSLPGRWLFGFPKKEGDNDDYLQGCRSPQGPGEPNRTMRPQPPEDSPDQ